MPGLLSNIFESDATPGEAGEGGHSDSASSHTSDTDTGAEAHLNPTLQVHNETNASWDNPDGSESSYSQTHDVAVNADVDAVLGIVTHIEQSDYGE